MRQATKNGVAGGRNVARQMIVAMAVSGDDVSEKA